MDTMPISMNVPRALRPWFLVKDRKFPFFRIGILSFSNLFSVYESDNDGKAPPVEYLSPGVLADFVCNELLSQLDEPLLIEHAHHIKSYLIQNAIESTKLSAISERIDEFIQLKIEQMDGLKVQMDDDIELLKELETQNMLWVLEEGEKERKEDFERHGLDQIIDPKLHIFWQMDDETLNRFKEKWETCSTIDNTNEVKELQEFKEASMALLLQLEGELRMPVTWTHIASAVAHEMTNALATKIKEVSSSLNSPRMFRSRYACTGLVNAINSKRMTKLTVSEVQYLESVIQRALPPHQRSPAASLTSYSYVHL